MQLEMTETENNDPNYYQIEKRRKYIGDAHFIPKSYVELGEFWGVVSQKQLNKGDVYARLKLLAQKSQGRFVFWTQRHELALTSTGMLSEEDQIMIEEKWRRVVGRITNHEMMLLDFLTLDPVEYNIERCCLIRLIQKGLNILGKL